MVDLHSHLIPGVDDGARDLDDARAALAAMRDAGIRTIVTTPHFDGSLTHRPRPLDDRLAALDAGWDQLRKLAAAEFPELALDRGVELRLDIPDPDLDDPRLRLAGSSAALVEFDAFAVPPSAAAVIGALTERGVVPVLAHPERYRDAPADVLAGLVEAGAQLQVNAGSLHGMYGDRCRAAGWALLDRGLVTLLSSDYHARGTLPVTRARAVVVERLGEEAAGLLFETNARLLLEDRAPLDVPAGSARDGLLGRVARWIGRREGR